MPKPTELLTAALSALATETEADDALAAIDGWKPVDWRRALLDLPLDERGYYERFEVDHRAAIARLWDWWGKAREDDPRLRPETVGCFGFYLLMVVAIHCSERARFHGDSDVVVDVGGRPVPAAAISAELVEDDWVRRAIEQLYDPKFGRARSGDGSEAKQARKGWQKIDFGSLRFHRHGTTSIILRGRSARPEDSPSLEIAFKCLIYPYQRQAPIAMATRSYASDYSAFTADDSPMAGVWASHESWILMSFLPGQTLAERLRSRPKVPPSARKVTIRQIDIEELDRLGGALLYALSEMEKLGCRHQDLAPSNIIVQDRGDRVQIRFIDLGVNHLYTRTLPGEPLGEAKYAAPEVRRVGRGNGEADLYSLGRLLLAISGAELQPDGSLPNHTYVLSIGMARLIEDLVDARPGYRLLVTPIDPGRSRLDQVSEVFRREMELIRESARLAPEGALEKLRSHSPGAGTVSRQGRIMRVRKRQSGDSPHLRQAQRLQRWAWVAAVLVWATAALVVTWWAEDLGISWQAKWIEMVNNVLAKAGTDVKPFTAMRLHGYDMPDPMGNLPARIVGASFALVNARLYLNLFAELSPLSQLPRAGRQRLLTIATEVGLRSMAVLPSLSVIVPTLFQGDWWTISTQLSLIWTAVVFSVFIAFERDTHRRARAEGLSTVPELEFPPGRLARWRPTLILYCVGALGMGTLIMLGLVQDVLVYACFVTAINLSIYYFKSAGSDAPRVRTELSRAFLAAERLDHLKARRASEEAAAKS
ncbi:protein kinase domain-containing protein [Glycomyces algeriensis]|uniref:non-specific serine/threonine protein kinase n=1 Tax=Glycomyces algeriensis TaxID=256037 RepID=A0A9W6LI59_9ACTN|nr:protein kinase [Glycomyces algeriensis]MDA1365607.1 hypothetical protein [Glycomyces algeriensis]MDR7351295.1 hypothetical protein [Glycomyces algeriensis]GLI44010.1 hypothetical protein GALLR39Z86_38600 [Glycomyces algeriensis]